VFAKYAEDFRRFNAITPNNIQWRKPMVTLIAFLVSMCDVNCCSNKNWKCICLCFTEKCRPGAPPALRHTLRLWRGNSW